MKGKKILIYHFFNSQNFFFSDRYKEAEQISIFMPALGN